MLHQLSLQRDLVALEAFALPNVSELVRKTIPNIVSGMKGFLSTLNFHQPAIALSNNQKQFLREMGNHNYMDIRPLSVFVPEGLDVPLALYSDELFKSLLYVETSMEEFNVYSLFLSRIITNPDELLSTNYLKGKLTTLNEELDAVIKGTASCFKKGSVQTERKIGDLVRNNHEWSELFTKATEMSHRIDKIDRKALTKKISECADLLDMLLNKQKRGELDQITPEMLSKIADYTYVVARSLEFYSVTYFRILAYVEALNKSIEKVNSILNK